MVLGITAWGLALISLGILSFISFILSLVGLPLSVVGYRKASAVGAPKGQAIAGIVLNTVGLGLAGLFLVLMIIGIATSPEFAS